MSKVFAIVGEYIQSICDVCPVGHIEMNGMRPEGDYVAGADGTWIDNTTASLQSKHMSGKEFMELFTPEELIAIYTHASTNINVTIWLHRLVGAEYVVRTDASLQIGMAYMVYQGLVTIERHNEIMVI
jgi:hypothetical protein